jgi:MarR-like DNA-binding transcriptional regulator SgrR of sgrS sRNA
MKELISKTIACLSMLLPTGHEKNMRLDSIATWLPGANKVPSPAKVISTSDWYLLNHVTGKLIHYNHLTDAFEPMLAESWTISGNTYSFKLRKDAKFSDGSPVTATDVANSIKFLIAQRTSTHFPVWEYFPACDQVKSYHDDCPAIKVIDPLTVSLSLKERLQSFFLLLTSPEGGIWSAADLARFERGEEPRTFSGPYLVSEKTTDHLVLSTNEKFVPKNWFPNRPKLIKSYFESLEKVQDIMKAGQIEIYFEAGRPFASHEYEPSQFKVLYSSPSTILYLFRVGHSKDIVNRSLISALWKEIETPEMLPAGTFLPFTSHRGIDSIGYLKSLPDVERKPKKIRVAVLHPYFSEGLLNYLQQVSAGVNYEIEFIRLKTKEWFAAFQELNSDKFDFVLSAYVASERFPSVQLRYLIEGYKIPFDITALDNPDWTNEEENLLVEVQKYILKEQMILPLFFVKNQIRYSHKLDIGDQPIMDADIQLWRLTKAK